MFVPFQKGCICYLPTVMNFKMFVPFQKGCICYLPTVKKISSQNTYRAVCQGIIDKGVHME